MAKLPKYVCPDIGLYKYKLDYAYLYKRNVFELDALLQYFDNHKRLNEAYKKLLRFDKLSQVDKTSFIAEIDTIKNELLEKCKDGINNSYKIISIADPLSSLEFIGLNSAKNYVKLFLIDFLLSLQTLAKNKAHIHLCPKLSILLIKAINGSGYSLDISKYQSAYSYPSLLELLLAKKDFSISALRCIHYYGNINNLAFFKLNKLD